MNGYSGKIATIDLSSGEKTLSTLDQKLIHEYVGGRGFISYWMYKNIPSNIDPFDAENLLMFAVSSRGADHMRADDTLPKRYLQEPLPDGAAEGKTVPLKQMLRDYYSARDWDLKTGYPSAEKLKSLNLEAESDCKVMTA